jgi:phosphopantetheine--protein transferase-like protein
VIFMSEREFSFFSNQPEETRHSWFYRIWTAKESFIKTTGKGISEGLQSITIDFSGSRIMVYKNEKLLPAYYFHEFVIDPFYKACVCGNDPFCDNPVFLPEITKDSLIIRPGFPKTDNPIQVEETLSKP